MKILILYERKSREFENSALLSIVLSKNGHECTISHFLDASKFQYVKSKFYDCIIVPHLYNTKSVFRNIVRFGRFKNIINLQYEQVLSEKWEKLGHHNPKGLAKDGYHICWGDITRERLISAGLTESHCITTGAIQNDLLRIEYRCEKLKTKESIGRKYGINSNSKWTLFLSSFTYADISEQRLKLNEAVAGIKLKDIVPYYTKSRNELLSWFDKLLSENFDGIFIYRPHPDELNLVSVSRLASKYKNFVIIGNEAAKVWIEASDRMYTWYSTTVVEAQLLGKSCAILRPFNLPDDFDSVLLKKGCFITNIDSFIQLHNSNKFIKPIDDKYIEGYYKYLNSPSFVNIANLIAEVNKNDFFTKTKIPVPIYITNQFKKIAIYIIFKIKAIDFLVPKGRTLGVNNNFITKWTLEMNNQILSDNDVMELKEKLVEKLKHISN